MNPRVLFKDLPVDIDGLIVQCFDSGEMFYTIIINACMNKEKQVNVYIHELLHIEQNDFDKFCKVDEIEGSL